MRSGGPACSRWTPPATTSATRWAGSLYVYGSRPGCASSGRTLCWLWGAAAAQALAPTVPAALSGHSPPPFHPSPRARRRLWAARRPRRSPSWRRRSRPCPRRALATRRSARPPFPRCRCGDPLARLRAPPWPAASWCLAPAVALHPFRPPSPCVGIPATRALPVAANPFTFLAHHAADPYPEKLAPAPEIPPGTHVPPHELPSPSSLRTSRRTRLRSALRAPTGTARTRVPSGRSAWRRWTRSWSRSPSATRRARAAGHSRSCREVCCRLWSRTAAGMRPGLCGYAPDQGLCAAPRVASETEVRDRR
jgi:hypothetical protein